MDEHKRRENERKFGDWQELTNGGRRYYYAVPGRYGWKARYVKEVDADERTVKFPADEGYKPVIGGRQ